MLTVAAAAATEFESYNTHITIRRAWCCQHAHRPPAQPDMVRIVRGVVLTLHTEACALHPDVISGVERELQDADEDELTPESLMH